MLLIVLDPFLKTFNKTSNISKLLRFAFIELWNIFILKISKRSKHFRFLVVFSFFCFVLPVFGIVQKRCYSYDTSNLNLARKYRRKTIQKGSKNDPKTVQIDPKTIQKL